MSAVSTAAELVQALQATGSVNIEVTSSINVSTGDVTGFVVANGTTATVTINEGVTITGVSRVFQVEDGGTLILKGKGTIQATTKKTQAAINVDGANAKVVLDGPTIDVFTANGKTGNYAYGIYALNGATVVIESGTIKAAYGSCVSTNNTTGGGTITIEGGSLLCDGSYAIYNPAYGVIRITGGTVQGLNLRMGEVYISGDAQIIGTTITDADVDDIGANISTSGCIWLGDTIALVMGTYTDPNGTDTVLEISGNAKVSSNYRAAIGTYLVDTKTASKVSIEVENPENVTTTASGYDAIKTYDHAYIAAAATAAGKAFTPTVDTEVTVVTEPEPTTPVDPEPVHPTDPEPEIDYLSLTASDLKAAADAANSSSKTKEESIAETTTAILKKAKKAADLGGYTASIPFGLHSIPWNPKYTIDVINRLQSLGYEVSPMFYANSMMMVSGINLKWI